MALERWHASAPVGHAQMDADYTKVHNAICQLTRLIAFSEPTGPMLESLKNLTQLVAEHFVREESLMCESGYPAVEEHSRKHKGFMVHLGRRVEAVSSGAAQFGPELEDEIQRWLALHAFEQDQPLADYLRELGSAKPVVD